MPDAPTLDVATDLAAARATIADLRAKLEQAQRERIDIRPRCIACHEPWFPPEGVDAQVVKCDRCRLKTSEERTTRAERQRDGAYDCGGQDNNCGVPCGFCQRCLKGRLDTAQADHIAAWRVANLDADNAIATERRRGDLAESRAQQAEADAAAMRVRISAMEAMLKIGKKGRLRAAEEQVERLTRERDTLIRESVAVFDRCVSVGMPTKQNGLAVGMIMAFVGDLAASRDRMERELDGLALHVRANNTCAESDQIQMLVLIKERDEARAQLAERDRQLAAAREAAYILGVNDAVVRIESWAVEHAKAPPTGWIDEAHERGNRGRASMLHNVAAAVRELAKDRFAALAATGRDGGGE